MAFSHLLQLQLQMLGLALDERLFLIYVKDGHIISVDSIYISFPA